MITPSTWQAGDSLAWDYSDSDHAPADGWALHYVLRGPQQIELGPFTGGGQAFAVSVSRETSAGFVPGDYHFAAYFLRDDVRETGERGQLTILEDLAGAEAPLSHARKMLAAIEALLEKRATKLQEEYTVNGYAIKYMSLPELREARKEYARLVHDEEVDAGLRPRTHGLVPVTFR